MAGLEVTVLLGLTVLIGTVLAPRLRVATPLVLLLFGVLLGFVPAIRAVQLPPEVVLLLFLPVMLFWESLTTSLRAIRRSLRYIAPMSTLLVVASAFAVAGVATAFGMPFPVALILGAAVAPPDATAVAALGRMLPQRMFMKLKAESLTNDGTALVLYAIAVSVALGGHVTAWSVTWAVIVSYGGGALVGIAVAALAALLVRRLRGALEINLVLLIVPFLAFLLAEVIGASGVLAVVIAGLIVAWVSPRITTAASRQQIVSIYPVGTYVLNGALFVLIGIEAMHVAAETSGRQIGRLLLIAVAVWAALIVVRFAFQALSAPFSHPRGQRDGRDLRLAARMWTVSTFAGFRGAVSLAIALSIPLQSDSGTALGARDEVIFVSAGVIMLSLLVQGPLLPAIARWARLPAETAAEDEFELAERTVFGAALAALDDLAEEHGVSDEVRELVRRESYDQLEYTNARAARRAAGGSDDGDETYARLESMLEPAGEGPANLQMLGVSREIDLLQISPLRRHDEQVRLRLALLERRREVLLRLRRSGTIDDLVAVRIQGEMDLVELKLRGAEQID